MENQQPVFKTTLFGGFDKNSVFSYVFELNNTAQEAQDKLSAQLEEISTARERLGDQLRDMESRMLGVQGELEGERTRSGELGKLIDSLNDELRKQGDIVAQKDEEIALHVRRYSELEARTKDLQDKKDEVERASAYIGELLLRTRADSEKIIADATRKAEDMVAEAGRSLEDVHAQFERFRTDMGGIQRQIQLSLASVQDKFAGITESVDKAENTLREFVFPQRNTELKLVADNTDSDAEAPPEESLFFRPAAEI